ncbi:hypothetical protein [Rhodobacter sp. CZR27]|uniref:hypothetical protein n=1 Tax=Rhodobacter sp. CZR27 TaxID=2033869 RepID=UPI0012FE4ED7|nr:hypothetical protein [Rhodobacter sp. CZR27]
MVQFADFVLDRYLAPEASKFLEFEAPNLTPRPDYLAAHLLNSVFYTTPVADNELVLMLIRRLDQAHTEYEAGRSDALRYVEALRTGNHAVRAYWHALMHFEQCIVATYLAVLAHSSISEIWDKDTEKPFQKGDGSSCERLNLLYTAIKHSHKWLQERGTSSNSAIWLSNLSLKGIQKTGQVIELRYDEIAEAISLLSDDATWRCFEVHRELRTRKPPVELGS